MRCRGPVNRLVMLGARGLGGPLMQNIGGGQCIKAGGATALRTATARSGTVLDANTVQIRFSSCVNVATPATCQVSIDGGAWENCTAAVDAGSGVAWDFTIAVAQTIQAGDEVRWRYTSGSSGIVDCKDSADIGDQQVNVQNDLVLEGSFFLLQTGGRDIFLLQDDTDGSTGFLLQDAV